MRPKKWSVWVQRQCDALICTTDMYYLPYNVGFNYKHATVLCKITTLLCYGLLCFTFVVWMCCRFLKGLSILGVLSMIRTYQKIMQEAFVYSDQVLDANRFEEAVDVHEGSWSPPGSNKRVDEERTYSYWLDYLLDLQGMACVRQCSTLFFANKYWSSMLKSVLFALQIRDYAIVSFLLKGCSCVYWLKMQLYVYLYLWSHVWKVDDHVLSVHYVRWWWQSTNVYMT